MLVLRGESVTPIEMESTVKKRRSLEAISVFVWRIPQEACGDTGLVLNVQRAPRRRRDPTKPAHPKRARAPGAGATTMKPEPASAVPVPVVQFAALPIAASHSDFVPEASVLRLNSAELAGLVKSTALVP